MDTTAIRIEFDTALHLFVPAAHRAGSTVVGTDGTSTLGHVVESLGAPLTEVGELQVDGRPVAVSHIPVDGESVTVRAVAKPQAVAGPLKFLLDIHLGTLARRMRLLGLDTAYENPDVGDAALAARSAAEERVMLSRDRGLLRRREIYAGAYIYSPHPATQLDEILARFEPPLAPWSRCTACNGVLRSVEKADLHEHLEQGTEQTYDTFAQCGDCGQAYWRGAHYGRLNEIVEDVMRRFGGEGGVAGA